MASLPNSLKKVAYFLERLPGIGEKTANRLAFYLLRLPDADLKEFSEAVAQLKTKTLKCSICLNLTEEGVCSICSDPQRDHGVITVVESVLDILSLETGNIYNGVYHVLHGRIDPLNNVGPEDIFIDKLVKRVETLLKPVQALKSSPSYAKATEGKSVKKFSGVNDKSVEYKSTVKLNEIILAMNPDMEGEATAMYIRNRIKELTNSPSFAKASHFAEASRDKSEGKHNGLKITRLGYGLPMGASLEYADYMTLKKSLENRSNF